MFIIGWNASNCHNVGMNETNAEKTKKKREIHSIENETKKMSPSDNELINLYILRYFIRNECVNREEKRSRRSVVHTERRKNPS